MKKRKRRKLPKTVALEQMSSKERNILRHREDILEYCKRPVGQTTIIINIFN